MDKKEEKIIVVSKGPESIDKPFDFELVNPIIEGILNLNIINMNNNNLSVEEKLAKEKIDSSALEEIFDTIYSKTKEETDVIESNQVFI